MNSVNANGFSQITLQFALSRDLDAAAQDVQAAISKAGGKLPPDLPTPPSFTKVNPADMPVLYIALTSATLPLSTVHEYADTVMAQRISMVSGVAQVQVYGAQKYAVRVQLDPQALASRGIGIDEVSAAVQKGNVNLPTGTLYGPHHAFAVQATGQLTTAAAYRPLIVTYRGGHPVRLEELGRVIDSVEENKIASWFTTTRAVVLAVQRQPGTNTIEVVDAVRKLLPTFRTQIPASIDLVILLRSFRIHPGLGAGCEIHPVSGHVPGDLGDFPVPAQPFGYPDPFPGAAHVHHRHLFGDVPVGLQRG
jgi:hydrophobic/amphiphilic exporter-1 (mainly G- bacteria), HAE1 family